MRFSPATSLVALALVILGSVVLSDRSPTRALDNLPASADGTLPGSAGMHVALDPETGELGMPSPEQQKQLHAELDEMLSRSTDGLRREVLPDGTVRVNLQGRFQNASIATIDAQGRLHTGCIDAAAAAPAPDQGTAPAAAVQCKHADTCTTLEVQ